jgi:hypothetical protein
MILSAKLKPSSVKSYLNSLATLHKLRNMPHENFSCYLVKTLVRGAENMNFYNTDKKETRKVMTLPLLKILGHALASCDWSEDSKQVFWSCSLLAFFGSLRMGEILPFSNSKFNSFETLLWRDLIFRKDSVLVHIKIPKSRNPEGDFIDIFEFPGHGCCPVTALKVLRNSKFKNDMLDKPVFQFRNGFFLTTNQFNDCLKGLLYPFIGSSANNLSAHSFRAALPSALATDPSAITTSDIKLWGRWHSASYMLYTRLKIDQKRLLFVKICSVLNKSQS